MPANNLVLPEKTLFDVLGDLWRGRAYMLSFAIVALIIAFAFVTFSQKYYRAEMIIAPASLMGQGMARGSDIGEGSIQIQQEELQSSAAFLKFENIYDGVSVALGLIKRKDIMKYLPENDWSVESLSEYLQKHVSLEPVSGTYLRRIIYLHPDQKFAVHMVAKIHDVSDRIIRNMVLLEVQGRIIYLDKALEGTINPGHRRNLTSLLMEQERIKMMVSLDQPYAAAIIEPPSVSSRPRWPDPYVIYPIFLFVGLLLGFITYGLRNHG